MDVSGVVAALAAPLTMTIGFVLWDQLWKGSAFMLNLVKCSLGTSFFLISLGCLTLASKPPGDGWEDLTNIGMLVLSSLAGIVIGDNTWLFALAVLGSRKIITVDLVKPFIAVLVGALLLSEGMSWSVIVGVTVTMVGVLIVCLEQTSQRKEEEEEEDDENTIAKGEQEDNIIKVDHGVAADTNEKAPNTESTEGSVLAEAVGQQHQAGGASCAAIEIQLSKDAADNPDSEASTEPPSVRVGYLMAVANVVLDVGGSVLTKHYGKQLTTWDINIIRFGFATFTLGAVAAVARNISLKAEAEREGPEWHELPEMPRKDWAKVCLGVALVTFACPALSTYALFKIDLAVCLTLTSLGPVYALPLTYIIKRESVGWMAILGVLAACSGVVIMCFGSDWTD